MQLPINFNLDDFRKREKIHQALEKKAKQMANKSKKAGKKEPAASSVSH